MMTTPRDRDAFDDDQTGRAWQEPAHLGGDNGASDAPASDDRASDHPTSDEPAGDEPNFVDRRERPRDSDHSSDPETWRPPGWDLPSAEPERPAAGRAAQDRAAQDGGTGVDPSWAPPGAPAQQAPAPERGGLFGGRRRQDPEMERAFTYQGDVVGAQSWALHHGWTLSDGTAPEDAALQPLIASAPVRPSKDHRPASVLRGRAGPLDLVAFDVVYASGRYLVPEYAITAAPLLGAIPSMRLSPARLWKHGVGGLVHVASGNVDFDRRWQLLAAQDGPQVRRLAADPEVQRLLLGSDDGDEFWTAAGHLAAIRPDGHRSQLIEHHARLLTALVGALAAGA